MKKILFSFLLCMISLSIAGCAHSGHFVRAEHNGKIYWLPPECEGYQPVANSENIMCFGYPNEISPTPNEEYEAYLHEREIRESYYYDPPVQVWIGGPIWYHHHWPRRHYHHPRRHRR